ncbi:MAG TPA: nitroreductase family deazaflavin-dependent oxidoreductase [Acidimicrobiia bacterium]|nr:nitroreductase family deazaflavin-dependent oxidoreductase [Acidimicrobiia bacterium]
MRDSAVRRWSRFHTYLYRGTRGLLGRRLVDNDMLLLTTVGHVTGRTHTVPLLYLREGERLVVIASYGGRPDHPAWYHNLMAQPRVSVQVNGDRIQMTAVTATAEEREIWWPRIEAAYDGYTEYQSRTERVIPVVFLESAE